MGSTIRETIEWRLIAFAVTFLITYVWAGKFFEATGLTLVFNVSKTIVYRLYLKIKKGHFSI